MSTTCNKCKKDKGGSLVGCEGVCNGWYHQGCIGLTDSQYKFLESNRNVFYLCDNCKRTCHMMNNVQLSNDIAAIKDCVSGVKDELGESISKKLLEIEATVNAFKAEVLSCVDSKIKEHLLKVDSQIVPKLDEISAMSTANVSKTYAQATQLSSIIIKPKNQAQTSSATKSELFQRVTPANNDLCVTKVKNISQGGLVVSCNSKNEAAKFKELVSTKLSENYHIKDASSLHPRIRIVGLSENLEKEVVTDYLKIQCRSLIVDVSEIVCISVSSLRKKSNVFQAVIQLDGKSYANFIDSKTIYLGYDYCRVYDGVEVRRCFNCSGFNHIATQCKSKVVCPKCAGDHCIKDCKTTERKCVNCVNVNKINNSVSFDHAAWENDVCFVYRQKMDNFKKHELNI